MIRLQEQPRQRSTIHPNNGKADRWIDRWGEKELTIYMSQLVIYLIKNLGQCVLELSELQVNKMTYC